MTRPTTTGLRSLVCICLSIGLISALPAAATRRPPQCMGEVVTIFARPGVVVAGTSGRDVIWGTSQADDVQGLGGPDLICARGGPDFVIGGGGNDLIRGGKGADHIHGNLGRDRLFGQGQDVLRGGGNNECCNPYRDILVGGQGKDLLFGDRGNNELRGGPGEDRLYGDRDFIRLTGDGDVVTGRANHVSYMDARAGVIVDLEAGVGGLVGGTARDDIRDAVNISGSSFGDFLLGNREPNAIHGRRGDDRLEGRDGDDFMHGWAGDDLIDGGRGDRDQLYGDRGHDSLNGGPGTSDACLSGEQMEECEYFEVP